MTPSELFLLKEYSNSDLDTGTPLMVMMVGSVWANAAAEKASNAAKVFSLIFLWFVCYSGLE
jgi:hypothetical protein